MAPGGVLIAKSAWPTDVSLRLTVLEVILAALKLPVESRLTMAFPVAALVGATFQFKPRVPLEVTGEPLTVKSEEGALKAMLVTVPLPPPPTVLQDHVVPLETRA